jgi:hypothetical protein
MMVPRAPSAADREVTIRALRDEISELEDQKGSIGYVFPSLFIVGGGALAIFGLTYQPEASLSWLRTTLIIGGTGIAVLSTFWLIYRIVKTISLGNEIDRKHHQLDQLEAQRVAY